MTVSILTLKSVVQQCTHAITQASLTLIELISIVKALEHASSQTQTHIIIFTDSKSVLQTLQNTKPKQNIKLITNILHQLHTLKLQSKNITLNWIPSHIGLLDNKIADESSKLTVICQAYA